MTRNMVTSGYSSLTDSQFLFGSQFWPENTQGTSQDMSLSSRNSQQSSQEGSDTKFSSNYHTKPLLFGDMKDKTRVPGMLDKFEEDRKKAKEKNDSDFLAKECQHIRETLNNIQQLVADTEKNAAVCQTVFEKIDNFASTLQSNLNRLQGDISQQFETLVNKVNSQKDVMTELEKSVQKNGDTTAELDSHLQSLKNSLDCLREEQDRERHMLEEALKLLNTLVSEHSGKPGTEGLMDNAIQTSPGLVQSVCNVLQENKLESTQLTRASYNLEQNQVEALSQDCSCIKRKHTMRSPKKGKKRQLVGSQRRKRIVSDENSQPLMICNKQQSVSTFLCDDRGLSSSQDSLVKLNREAKSSKAAGCYITPLSCWSQDSNSPVGLTGVEVILEKLIDVTNTRNPVKPASFCELFDMNDSDFDL